MNKSEANELIHETSPYLLQHAYNPVKWVAWNDNSLKKAKEQNKLIIVSVGYAACHWCHVMEHESFEDSEVAQVMNDSYVSIKVDREERPDLDQVYMDAAYIITGQGGWPLNVICLPDGRPIYAGTYFRKQQWVSILAQLDNMWLKDTQTLLNQADQIEQRAESFELNIENTPDKLSVDVEPLVFDWLQAVDWIFGGEQGAPKFPMPNNYEFLFQQAYYKPLQSKAQEFAAFSVEQISKGGIYDHVGGGFARYAVDQEWHVPHFEKMLYDNGQLLSLLSHGYQVTKNEFFKQTVEETTRFLTEELRSPKGGFYSSYDADSEGVEGKFYVFSKEEIEDVLGEHAALFNAYFDVSEHGNWEETNVLRIVKKKEELLQSYKLSEATFDAIITKAKQLLYNYREERIHPGLDDKILTSWNALAIKGFVDAYKAFSDPSYKTIALKTAEFLVENVMQADGQLFRNYKNEKATINAFLDDYALLAEAFIALYEITFDEIWLNRSQLLVNHTLANFFDDETGLFFYTSTKDKALITRKKETSDNVIPSSNSSMFKAMFQLAKLTANSALEGQVIQALKVISVQFQSSPRYYSNWLQLVNWIQNGVKEVAIVGENAEAIRKEMQMHFLPNTLFVGSTTASDFDLLKGKYQEGKTMIYVCENRVCQRPVEKVNEAMNMIVPG